MGRKGAGSAGGKGLKLRVLLAILAAALVIALLYLGGRWMEKRAQKPEVRGDASLRTQMADAVTIEFNGQTYVQRKGLVSILLMGVDKRTTAQVTNSKRNGGQADFLRLLVIDAQAQTIRQLAIDRDTMTPITILGVLGNRTGTRTERISLSHGFGDGKEESCELTVEAVSNLLYSTPIDFYVAMDMDGISDLNDWLGGVTVTLEDDFSAIDPAMKKGETLTLHGDQAEIYVRERLSVGVGTNEARMRRQQQYLDQAQRLLKQKLASDEKSAENLYDSLIIHLTTNMSRGRMLNEIYHAKDYAVEDILQPAGVHSIDAEGFMQFVVEEESLQQAVVQLFYEKAD